MPRETSPPLTKITGQSSVRLSETVKNFIALILSCAPVMGADTGIHVTTLTRTLIWSNWVSFSTNTISDGPTITAAPHIPAGFGKPFIQKEEVFTTIGERSRIETATGDFSAPILITVGITNLNVGLAHRGPDVRMNVLHVHRVHVISHHPLQQECRKLDTMLAIWNILLNQRPHLGAVISQISPSGLNQSPDSTRRSWDKTHL